MSKTKEQIKEEVKKGLLEKGVDEPTAEHLSSLASESEVSKKIMDDAPVPGNCNLTGIFPG